MLSESGKGGRIDRRNVVWELLHPRQDMLVVSGLGSTSYDVFDAGDSDANQQLMQTESGPGLATVRTAADSSRRVLPPRDGGAA